ncbi:MAG: hypothetical protein M3O70_24055 [Actinomycetota bacterium]|nr:hypothetical protein [Actinomycetota bacterium]
MIRDVDVEAEIKDALGLVPSFFARIPDEAMAHEWDLFHHCELEETLIPSKYKELLMLAVHAETRCHYCTLFHTEVRVRPAHRCRSLGGSRRGGRAAR